MRLLILMLTAGLALVTVACGGQSGKTATPAQDTAITPGGSLPLPGDLREVSAVYGFQATGGDFQDNWGYNRVEVDGTSLEFTPDWPAQGHGGLAYALFVFQFDHTVARDEISLTWSEHGDFSDLWLGLADITANCWDFTPGDAGIIPLSVSTHLLDNRKIYLALAITGNDTWVLDGIDLGSTPTVTGVDPLWAAPGEVVALTPELTGTATSWDWAVGSAGSLDDATVEQPSLTATTTAGTYACTVTAANGFGTGPAYEFELATGPPKITGVSPHGINDTVAWNFFIPEYHGQIDTWSWELSAVGNVTSPNTEQGGVSGPYNVGIHDCSVTATNSYGSDTYHFKVAVWHEEGIVSNIGDWNGHIDLVIGDDGTPHVSYHCDAPEGLSYATRVEGSWQNTAVETGDSLGQRTAITLDSNGYPRIASRALAGDIHYSVYDGSTWSTSVVPDANTDQPDLELDASGNPLIAFADQTTGSQMLHLFSNDGADWADEICIEACVTQARMKLDPDGRPVTAAINSNWYLTLINVDGEWEALPLIDSQVLDSFSLAIDPVGNPHLVYMDRLDSDLDSFSVMHAAWNGEDWEIEVLREGGVDFTTYTMHECLAYDSLGTLHAIYGSYSSGTDRVLWYTRRIDGEWEHFEVSNTYSSAHWPVLALDADDNPCIVHSTGFSEQLLYETLAE